MAKLSPERLNNYLMTILTSVSIAVLGFLWNVNNTVVKMQQKDSDRDNQMIVIEGKIDKLDESQQENKDNTTRLSYKVDNIQYMLNNKKYSK